jgi:hypothetical protein
MKNSQLLDTKKDLQQKIKLLEEEIVKKGGVVPRSIYRKPKLTFALKQVTLSLLSNRSQSKRNANPAQANNKVSSQSITFYKNCILASNGLLYEDDALRLALVRTTELSTMTISLKLNFFNKSTSTGLVIHQFFPSQYEKEGNVTY